MGKVRRNDLSTSMWRIWRGGRPRGGTSTYVRGLLLAVLALVIAVSAGKADADSASNRDGPLAGSYFALRLAEAESEPAIASDDYGFLAGSYFAMRLAASESGTDREGWKSLKQYYARQSGSQVAASTAGSEVETAASSDDDGFLAGSYFAIRLAASESGTAASDYWDGVKQYYAHQIGSRVSASTGATGVFESHKSATSAWDDASARAEEEGSFFVSVYGSVVDGLAMSAWDDASARVEEEGELASTSGSEALRITCRNQDILVFGFESGEELDFYAGDC